ncbi:hypothetical protein OSTOST_01430 [Ostertagia ostertagi]
MLVLVEQFSKWLGEYTMKNKAAKQWRIIQRILEKKIEFPDYWDVLLTIVVYAYNATPHTATGESPFFLLHAFYSTLPLISVSESRLKLERIDVDDYKSELIRGIRLIQNEVKQHNERYLQKMKQYYDERKGVNNHHKSKVCDRVFMRMPREKYVIELPELAVDWSGPFRVLEVTDNSALIKTLAANEDLSRVQFDLLIKCPREIDDESVCVVTRRKRGRNPETKGAVDEFDVNDTMHFLHVMFK